MTPSLPGVARRAAMPLSSTYAKVGVEVGGTDACRASGERSSAASISVR